MPSFKTNQKPGWSRPELRVYWQEHFGGISFLDELAYGTELELLAGLEFFFFFILRYLESDDGRTRLKA